MLRVVNRSTDSETRAAPRGGQYLQPANVDDSTAPDLTAQADAAALGVSALAGVVAGAPDGITIVDADRRFVYPNPVAYEMLGNSLAELRGRDFLDSIPVREHAVMLARLAGQVGYSASKMSPSFSCSLRRPDGPTQSARR